MNPAACSCRVKINRISEFERASSRSRFSSPGIPKTYSTPSASKALMNRSDALNLSSLGNALALCRSSPSFHPNNAGY